MIGDVSIPIELAAYLAGAIDSDGTIGIRRSTYAMRVTGDSRNPTYSERVCLKQVTPQIPELLRECFGGSLMVQAPSVTKGRPLHYWEATNKKASDALAVTVGFAVDLVGFVGQLEYFFGVPSDGGLCGCRCHAFTVYP